MNFRDVARARSKRREALRDRIDMIEQVIPEAAVGDFVLQGQTTGGHKAGIECDLLAGAQGAYGAIRKDTKKLCLKRQSDQADLVEKNHATAPMFEASDAGRRNAVKSACDIFRGLRMVARIAQNDGHPGPATGPSFPLELCHQNRAQC
ncbi:MAG: hypothetical protein AAGG56_08110 [Pseudomonadota bacterium]